MIDVERRAGVQVSGDSRLTEQTTNQLKAEGFSVLNGGSPRSPSATTADIFVLTVATLDDSAVAEIARIRKQIEVPLIVVGGRGTSRYTVRALQSGADECIIRPYSAKELGARVRAVLRRTTFFEAQQNHIVRTGKIAIDFERRLLTKDGIPVHLSRTEWRLIGELARNIGRIVPSAQLLARVWGPQYENETQYLRVRIWKLRRLLEDDPANPQLLTTIPRVGYRLEIINY
jgi:two-component system, OmpR family, KDP operon response regulator KdpE